MKRPKGAPTTKGVPKRSSRKSAVGTPAPETTQLTEARAARRMRSIVAKGPMAQFEMRVKPCSIAQASIVSAVPFTEKSSGVTPRMLTDSGIRAGGAAGSSGSTKRSANRRKAFPAPAT